MRVAKSPATFRKSVLANTPEVKFVGNELHFPDDWTDEAIIKFIEDSQRKAIDEAAFTTYTPSDSDIAIVKTLMIGPDQDVTKFGFYKLHASNTSVDLHDEKLTKALLEELAIQYRAVNGQPGQSVLINHGMNNFAGATFDANVMPMEGSSDQWVLWIKVYVPDRIQFQGNSVLDLINTRTISKASIQFRPGKVSWQEVADKVIGILDVDPNRKSEAIEVSFVYKGAVREAGVQKSAANQPVIINRSNMLSFTKTFVFGDGTATKSFQLKFTGGDNPTVEGQEPLEAYVKSVLDENARLKKAEADSKKPLVDGVIALQKKLNQPEDQEGYLYSLGYSQLSERQKFLQSQDKTANPKNQATKPDAADASGKETPADDAKSVYAKMLEEGNDE